MMRFYAMAGEPPEAVEFDGIDDAIGAAADAVRLGAEMAGQGWSAQANAGELAIYDEMIPGLFDVSGFLNALASMRGAPVTVAINSPGGDAFMGIALYNALARYAGPVTVRIDGIAASAASLVAMAGKRVVMPENAFVMIHNPYSWGMGDASDFEARAQHLARLQDIYSSVYARRSGQPAERIVEMMEATTYMTAAEALAAGFCDEVEPAMQAAAFNTRLLPGAVPAALLSASSGTLGTQSAAAADPEPAPAEPPAAEHPAGAVGLDPKLAAAERAGARAVEIAELCALVGKADLTLAFIASSKTAAEVRAELRGMTRPAPGPDNRLPAAGTTTKPTLNPVAVYAKWNGRKEIK